MDMSVLLGSTKEMGFQVRRAEKETAGFHGGGSSRLWGLERKMIFHLQISGVLLEQTEVEQSLI